MRESVLPAVMLKKGKARPFWHGNPIVFSGAVADVRNAEPGAGDLVEVRDNENRLIGWGFYNPVSQYRVRIVALASESAKSLDIGTLLRMRIEKALALRQALGLPASDTTAFRLLNSEGDGLSGLTADVFIEAPARRCVVVVVVSAYWVMKHREIVTDCIHRTMLDYLAPFLGHKPEVVVLFRIARAVAKEEGISSEMVDATDPGSLLFKEGGLLFKARFLETQKTGFYLDQRENRALVRCLAQRLGQGARACDAFCFSGGFGINLAVAGVSEVVAIDTSQQAIEIAEENAAMNRVEDKIFFQKGDALRFLETSHGAFDIVVCDPPGYAKSSDDVQAALKKYKNLNKACLLALKPRGLLVTCTCSAAVKRDMFLKVLRDAAKESGRRFVVTHVRGAAPDHPLHPAYLEGEYLTCVIGYAH